MWRQGFSNRAKSEGPDITVLTAEPKMQRTVQQARTFGQLDSWGLRSPGTLSRVNGWLLTDISGLLVCPILTGQAVFWDSRTLEDWTHRSPRNVANNLSCRNSEGLNYLAVEARSLSICFPDKSQCDRLSPVKLGMRGEPLRSQDHKYRSRPISKSYPEILQKSLKKTTESLIPAGHLSNRQHGCQLHIKAADRACN